MQYLHFGCLLMNVQEMQIQYTVYLSFQPSSHEIFACPDNTATPLKQPNVYDPLVTILMGFRCIPLCTL